MDFALPENFILFGIIPFLIWWYLKKSSKRIATVNVSAARSFSVRSAKVRMRHLPFIVRMLAIAVLIIALAKPQRRNDQQLTEGEGIDIILCIDVSGSMNSPDIVPSRMEVAKQTAEEFIMSRPVDRIGVVIFSGESFTLVPLTTDKNTLVEQVRALESRQYLADGTVIGEGLATSVDRLSKSQAKSKVVILLTDGKEDPPETRLIDPLTALEIAKAKGVKVYTIGMSAAATAASTAEAAGGRDGANATNQRGQPREQNAATSYLDEDLLAKIASQTGGRYFRARDEDGLNNIYKQIDTMEKSKVDISSFKKVEELFFPFVLAALFFVLLEVVLRFTLLRRFP